MAQGNALGGEGLTQLCPGVAACTTLVELNLRAVGITEQHKDAVRRFADVVSCHEALQVVNLDGNLIGANICTGLTTWTVTCNRILHIALERPGDLLGPADINETNYRHEQYSAQLPGGTPATELSI